MQHQRNPRDRATTSGREAVRAYATMNTLRALEALAREPLSAPELAARLQIGIRSARRLLQRLELEGYAVQGGGHRRRFRATLQLAAVGREVAERGVLPRAAAKHVAQLASATRCTAHLWIAADEACLCVLHAIPPTAEPPKPFLREMVTDSTGAITAVLSHQQHGWTRCSSYALRDTTAVAVASVLDGSTVAALGITGDCTVEMLAAVAESAELLEEELRLAQ